MSNTRTRSLIVTLATRLMRAFVVGETRGKEVGRHLGIVASSGCSRQER